jgi:hypothetical protein
VVGVVGKVEGAARTKVRRVKIDKEYEEHCLGTLDIVWGRHFDNWWKFLLDLLRWVVW